MKPSTIATDHGIFTLDDTGFYVPLDPPEEPSPWAGPFLYALAFIGGLGAVGLAWALFA